MKKSKRNKKRKMTRQDKRFYIICFSIFFICVVGIVLYYVFFTDSQDKKVVKKKPKSNIKIVDLNSNKRPIAIMIDNNVGYNSHAGLQDSYLNYEIIVEGGLTRIMALFKDKDVDLIGPVRSSRHYFLDYAAESDSIYAHYGWSPFAESDIKSLGINNINGMTDTNAYWRDKALASPHNVFTSTDTIYKIATKKDYDVETENWQLLDYSSKEIKFEDPKSDEVDNRLLANEVVLRYSNYQTTSYKYDSQNNYYLRFMDGKEHIDKTTKKQLHYKNIIIEQVENSPLDSDGRQDLSTTGSGDGYYITNGFALPINWTKSSRTGKTTYTYLDGSKVKVNDGNTFIQVIPLTTTAEIN